MVKSQNGWRDNVWLAWFALQVPIIFCVDAVEFYPEWLWVSPDSPLHFLHTLRQHYIDQHHDPIFDWQPERGPSFAPLFIKFEMIYVLPVVLFTVYRLARGRGITGPHELLLLLYGFATAGCCGVCLNDINYWDPKLYSPEQKDVFRYQLYGPWFVIPLLVFVDMFWRLMTRLNAVDMIKKRQ